MNLLFITLTSVLLASLSGIFPVLCFNRCPSYSKATHFVLLGISGVGLAISGAMTLIKNLSLIFSLSTSFPLLAYSVHLDALSGFFLVIIGIIVIALSFYGPSYLKFYEKTRQSINALVFFTGVLVASMSLVVLANNIFSFVFAWELMSLSGYFLVIYHHEDSENRHAGFVYLLMAHLSGLFILLAFGILAKFSGGVDFQAMQIASLSTMWATLAFLFAFMGFGLKAGLIPGHVWLPKADPAAPSHIAALMSGVMLKIAVYGFIRFVFILIGQLHWQWGVWVLLIGSISAIVGVLYALMQHDLKRLLAYHSVENIGIIFIGLGLSIIFISNGHPVLGALGLVAALYHCLNHAIFKSLLFFGAGSVIQHTHAKDLEHMGGLIHKMPQTAFFFLIGCVSISALPPFNGFVSEWLTFQTALQASVLHSGIMRIMIPAAAATLALTGALAAACFAKVYGIAFLGKPRTKRVKNARKPSIGMRIGMGFLALLCLLFGVLPSFTINFINAIPLSIFHVGLPKENLQHWLWVMPLSPNVSSYGAPLVFGGLIFFCFIVYLALKYFSHSFSFKKVSAWDCGFGGLNSRMQYTSTAFAMPIRRVFKRVWKINETIINYGDETGGEKRKYELHVKDWIWHFCYEPLNGKVQKISKFLAKLQGGNIRVYLAYTFVTLLLLLLVIS